MYNIFCTVSTQCTLRQGAIITIRLYLATCFGRKLPPSGQLRTILRYSKNGTQWDSISFRLKLDKMKIFIYFHNIFHAMKIFILSSFNVKEIGSH